MSAIMIVDTGIVRAIRLRTRPTRRRGRSGDRVLIRSLIPFKRSIRCVA